MLSRFRKRNMLLEDLPSVIDPNTLYPNTLSAEYFQSIQDNTLFNHLGYSGKAKEAYGVMTLLLQRNVNIVDGPVQNENADTTSFVNEHDGRVWPGIRTIQVNFNDSLNVRNPVTDDDGEPYTGDALTGESAGKIEGTNLFGADDSYTVQTTVEQFIGVDFTGENPGPGTDIVYQPLINPLFQARITQFRANDPLFLSTNRHNERIRPNEPDRDTRSTYITANVFQHRRDSFTIYVKRNHVWAEVQTGVSPSHTGEAIVNDYLRTKNETYAEYTPISEPSPPYNNPPITFHTDGVIPIPRNKLRIAWYAKGV